MGQTQEKDHKLNRSDCNSTLRSIDDLMDMGFSIPDYSSIPTVGNAVPKWPEGPGTSASVLTSTHRPEGGHTYTAQTLPTIEVLHK